jgi:DNA-binding response OmpR family regulator
MTSERTILIADDDARLRNLLTLTLEQGQFRVIAAADGLSALELAHEQHPDMYLLDVGMPGLNGIDLCRRLREERVIEPILMLTGFGAEADKVAGLEAGADDYQTKPFHSKELLARVNALLRRSSVYAGDSGAASFTTGDLTVDFDQHLAFKNGRKLDLTPTEFNILALLARTPDQVVRSQTILEMVWGPAYAEEVHVLRVNVARLRRKVEDLASEPRYIATHPRVGYSLATL